MEQVQQRQLQLIQKQKYFGFEIYLKKELSKEGKNNLLLKDIEYDYETGLIFENVDHDATFLIEIHTLKGSLIAVEIDKQKNITQKSSLRGSTRQVVSSKGKIFGVYHFFQAEDGIRDIGVTGVQTCALPI